MNESKNKTVTYLPKGEHSATLSTTGRLMAYNDQLKNSLENGFNFTKLLDTLISTNSVAELLTAVAKLTNYQLDTAFLTFPQRYSRSDFYLIFLNRLLELHQRAGMILQSSDQYHELYHEFPGINTKGYFIFQLEDNQANGAFYIEKKSKLKLFYLNFSRHVLRFNSHALTQLLLVDYFTEIEHQKIKSFAVSLWEIGKFLKEDFGFDVDFGLLDPANNCVYQITDPQLPSEILDRLFIAAAAADKMLEAGANQTAILRLNDQVIFKAFRQTNPEMAAFGEWGLAVQDPNQKVSLFDVLLKYDFLKDWYLNNLVVLEIKADQLYFS